MVIMLFLPERKAPSYFPVAADLISRQLDFQPFVFGAFSGLVTTVTGGGGVTQKVNFSDKRSTQKVHFSDKMGEEGIIWKSGKMGAPWMENGQRPENKIVDQGWV